MRICCPAQQVQHPPLPLTALQPLFKGALPLTACRHSLAPHSALHTLTVRRRRAVVLWGSQQPGTCTDGLQEGTGVTASTVWATSIQVTGSKCKQKRRLKCKVCVLATRLQATVQNHQVQAAQNSKERNILILPRTNNTSNSKKELPWPPAHTKTSLLPWTHWLPCGLLPHTCLRLMVAASSSTNTPTGVAPCCCAAVAMDWATSSDTPRFAFGHMIMPEGGVWGWCACGCIHFLLLSLQQNYFQRNSHTRLYACAGGCGGGCGGGSGRESQRRDT